MSLCPPLASVRPECANAEVKRIKKAKTIQVRIVAILLTKPDVCLPYIHKNIIAIYLFLQTFAILFYFSVNRGRQFCVKNRIFFFKEQKKGGTQTRPPYTYLYIILQICLELPTTIASQTMKIGKRLKTINRRLKRWLYNLSSFRSRYSRSYNRLVVMI